MMTIMSFRVDFRFIHFVLIPSAGKTGIWSCRNNRSGEELGRVQWYGAWRQYCYFPTEPAVYSAGCLQDIDNFIKRIGGEKYDKP